MSSTNRGAVRVKNDFYATPGHVTRAILPLLPTHGKVIEPGCGSGAIVQEVLRHGVRAQDMIGIELDPELAKTSACGTVMPVIVGDYLTMSRDDISSAWLDVGLIIGNPPFSLAQEFVERSLELAKSTNGTVAMLLRLAFLESKKRAAFHKANPCDVFVLSERPSFTGDGKSDSCAYAWLVWGPGRGNRWRILDTPDVLRKAAS